MVLDVYPARERAEDFPGRQRLLVADAAADAAGGRPGLVAADDGGGRARAARASSREGDLLVTLGAGDVDALAERLAGLTP